MTANLAKSRPRGVSRTRETWRFSGVFTPRFNVFTLARDGLMAIVVIFSLQLLLDQIGEERGYSSNVCSKRKDTPRHRHQQVFLEHLFDYFVPLF